MDDLVAEVGKGFARALGYLLAQIFFGGVCYLVGWPLCKLFTLGRYPSPPKAQAFFAEGRGSTSEFWCSSVGLLVLLFVGLYLMGQF